MPPKPLPQVPAPIVASAAPAPLGRRVPQPQNAPVRSVFDSTPAAVSAARKSSESARRSMSGSLQSLRNTMQLVEASAKAIGTDAETAAVFAHEGLTPEVLKQFGDLATPLLKAFTAA